MVLWRDRPSIHDSRALALLKIGAGAGRIRGHADVVNPPLVCWEPSMNILLAWRKQLQAQIASKTFIARELALGYVRSGPAMKILISERDGWTHTINRKLDRKSVGEGKSVAIRVE